MVGGSTSRLGSFALGSVPCPLPEAEPPPHPHIASLGWFEAPGVVDPVPI